MFSIKVKKIFLSSDWIPKMRVESIIRMGADADGILDITIIVCQIIILFNLFQSG